MEYDLCSRPITELWSKSYALCPNDMNVDPIQLDAYLPANQHLSKGMLSRLSTLLVDHAILNYLTFTGSVCPWMSLINLTGQTFRIHALYGSSMIRKLNAEQNEGITKKGFLEHLLSTVLLHYQQICLIC